MAFGQQPVAFLQAEHGFAAQGVKLPTVLRSGPYRIFFFSYEPNEPPHVHVDREQYSAKIWLHPVSLARNIGFSAHELSRIIKLVTEHQSDLLEAWNGYFGSRR